MSNSAIDNFDFLHKKREHKKKNVLNDNTIGYRLYKEPKEDNQSFKLKHILSLLSEYFKLIKKEFKRKKKVPSDLERKQLNQISTIPIIKPNLEAKKIKKLKTINNSKQKLQQIQNYYNANIEQISVEDIHQPFTSPISSNNFYTIAFYFIKTNYVDNEIGQLIKNITFTDCLAKPRVQYLKKKMLLNRIITFFDLLKDYDFDSIEHKTPELQNFYRDILLSAFKNYKAIEDELYTLILDNVTLTQIDTSAVFNIYKGTKYNECNWKMMKEIATSPVAIEAFKQIAVKQELFDASKKSDEILSKEIREEIIRILDGYKIYIGDIDTYSHCTYGITSVDRILILNRKLISHHIFTDQQKLQANSSIILTILHEINHSLIRLKRNNNNNNYINDTQQFNDENDILENGPESGEYFDRLIIGEVSYYPHKCAKYITTISNWNCSLALFKSMYQDIYKDILNEQSFSYFGFPVSNAKFGPYKMYPVESLPYMIEKYQKNLRLFSMYSH